MNLQESLNWIDAQRSELLDDLCELSAINSGTSNHSGISQVREVFSETLSSMSDHLSVIKSRTAERADLEGNLTEEYYGDMLDCFLRPDAPIQVLLVGHLDTVFPVDHPFQSPVIKDESVLHGPGVADMKGGILAMLTALRAYEHFGGSRDLGWRVILNADEETGSHGSADYLVAAAKKAHAGLIYEPGLADGTLSRARKGSANFTLIARGQSAHAGREFEKGINAIAALSRAVQQISELTDLQQGITVNIGRIAGGTALNVVPDSAVCQFNVRCWTKADQERFMASLGELLAKLNKADDCSFDLHGGFTRPPKSISPANELLMDWAVECGNDLSTHISFADTGGCCDGNNLAAAGLPNIDTLGVMGGHIHTDQEFMLIDSLPGRAKLSLLLLNKLAEQGEELLAARETASEVDGDNLENQAC